jgi:hypothetical protein
MALQTSCLVLLLTTLLPVCHGFSVTTTNDANVLANAIFTGPGITVVQASFSGAGVSSGTFTDGLGGIGNGAILTSGAAVRAVQNDNSIGSNGVPGDATYCGPSSYDAALLTVDILINPAYSGVQVEFIVASKEQGYVPSGCLHHQAGTMFVDADKTPTSANSLIPLAYFWAAHSMLSRPETESPRVLPFSSSPSESPLPTASHLMPTRPRLFSSASQLRAPRQWCLPSATEGTIGSTARSCSRPADARRVTPR